MPASNFIDVLGRLLRDGALRDALAADPCAVIARLGVSESDQPALLQLAPDDLEFQARVLLRKRFDCLRHMLPGTFLCLGEEAWPTFHRYARAQWPSGDDPTARDACEFCRYLEGHYTGPLCDAEMNRVRFAFSKRRLALHWVRHAFAQKNPRPALQLLFRTRNAQWRELMIYAGI